MSTLLSVEDLSIDYGRRNPVHAVRNVSLSIEEDEFVGLVGESGCGKSTLGFAIARLERPPAQIVGGRIHIGGNDWMSMDAESMRKARWETVSVVLQSGMNALNPIMTIGAQFRDVMEQHGHRGRRAIEERAVEVLDLVQIRSEVLRRYPHELSGGMKQRIAIALSLVLRPKLVIMDEPTTALDMVVQRQILENLKALRHQQSFAMLFISHDLGLVLELVDRVVVMYAGEIIEEQSSRGLLKHAWHPYTRALMDSLPDPENPKGSYQGIPGSPPDLHVIPEACMYAPRCPLVQESCRTSTPSLETFQDVQSRCPVTRQEVVDGVGVRS
ncbi:MAG: ABC transporter ATP-binding protein [Alicyclobacillaceae bacterium]|nr:ABC transporter ATP-binding protein [Alicyclobacillaceae bacterium]